MLKGKEIKKVFPYFNKIITANQKEKSFIEVKCVANQLIFTLIESAGISIIYSIPVETNNTFEGLFFRYKDISSTFSKVKANDEIQVIKDEHRLKVIINDEIKYLVSEEMPVPNTTSTNVKFICDITEYNLLKSIEENKVLSSRGAMDYNNNLFFKVSNQTLNIYSINDIAMVSNSISVVNQNEDAIFAISNEDVSMLYKWINAIKNLKIQIALSKDYVFFKTKNEVLKIYLVEIANIENIIGGFDVMNKVELKMLNEYKLSDIKKTIYEESNKLSKEDNCLKLSKNFERANDDYITISKKLFLEIIKVVSEDSKIGLLDNQYTPIIISNIEEGSNHKIIFNLTQ